ncbi:MULTISPECIES: alpha/beta fold hydrolase [Microbulbifer]|uniref:alpha/beta fold hydrolase n=1 Tax=Microbulbifer TaxID=48073 RepID=UPI001F36D492|nr:alpha/beta fold hydrolase [Microbulbifer zhoushanensis]
MPVVQRDSLALHYEIQGSGPALVLLHSFLCSGAMWREQVEALAEHYTVITVDIRGHGKSSVPQQPFSIYDLMEDALAVLDREGIDSAIWAGLSIGGMIALRAAVKAPQRVRGLILMDTHAGPEKMLKQLRYRLMVLAARIFGIRLLLPQVNKLMFGDFTLVNKRDLVNEWQEEFARVPMPTIAHGVNALCRRDSLLSRLGLIEKPTLVIVGDDDRSLPPHLSREIADSIEGARLEMIAKAGHLTALEQPQAVNEKMLEFLRKIDAGEAASSPSENSTPEHS